MNYGKLTAGTTKTAIDTAKPSEKGEIITYLSRMGDVLHDIPERSKIIFPLFAVHAIVDRNKADVVIGEKGIRIVTNLQIVPAEPGHILYDYRSNITGLNVLNHLLKAGTVEVCTCITIIHIEFGIRKMMVFGIFGKQLFLIDNAVAVALNIVIPGKAGI